ncbi:MAG: 2-dehydropantoate 2-reductase [Deltaproteobacteria bacterium]|nr:2-dehydropantoate 2-reductase [Deltaproteobacteria bacterium]
MKTAVVGPGALGCLLAASFLEAGEEVVLVDYRPERAALLRKQGIQIQTLDGAQKVVHVPDDLPPEAGVCQLVIMAVKAHQTRAASRSLPDLMAKDTVVLTLQNGLGNLEEMAGVVGREPLLAGVAFLGVTRRDEGRVVHAGAGAIIIGAPPGSRVTEEEVQGIVSMFRRAGWDCQAHPDIQTLLWDKLLVNVGINPFTALLRVPNGVLLELPEAWDLAVAAAREAQAVAQAGGVPLRGDPEERLRQVCTATAANRSSMLQDVLAGRPTEIEALNAQVVARGAALGVATPVNYVLTQLLRAWGRAGDMRVG